MNDTDDWFDVRELSDRTWRVSEATYFNDYLVAGEDRALLVDASVGVGDLRAMADELVDVPVTLLLTHSHWDHVGGATQFDDVRIHEAELPPNGTVRWDYVADTFHVHLDEWLDAFREGGGQFPDGFDPTSHEIRPVPDVSVAADGETVDLGGRKLELLHLPGHSPGQLGVLDRERGDLYGGDVLHLRRDLYAHFGGGDLGAYADTFARLRALRDEGAFDTLYTAHNRPVSGEDLSLLDDYHAGLRAILAGELSSRPNDGRPPGRVYDVAGHEVVTRPDVE
ncbi:MBL fold metallo-hydrolase [Halomarina litorea]|uniref:MBL fold metallo-hydrolase n=1 Tax=Halomarina litorea TaxID=2961595 RepID=UPI0020C476FC|nr:MBL fold metallo-hydrolase [Halomarina sp. BCD28]